MDMTLKIIVGLIALLLLFMGANLMFAPVSGAEGFSITAVGADGLNTIRGDLGGMFLAGGALLVLGLVQGRSEWFLAVAVLMAFIATGRLVGFVMDGGPGAQPLQGFIGELIITAVLVFASRRLGPARSEA